jgi:hypothetical protein
VYAEGWSRVKRVREKMLDGLSSTSKQKGKKYAPSTDYEMLEPYPLL